MISKSPSVSRTLGNEDTDPDSSGEKPQDIDQNISDGKKPIESDTKAPWVNLFKDNKNIDEGFKLKMIDDQPNIINVVDQEVNNVEKSWGFYLKGHFAGRFLVRRH